MDNRFYTFEQIAENLNTTVCAVKHKIYKRGIKRAELKNNIAYYHSDVLKLLSKEQPIKYYPLKTTITYHIYESKMNTL